VDPNRHLASSGRVSTLAPFFADDGVENLVQVLTVAEK
jgi:hypothetical protein